MSGIHVGITGFYFVEDFVPENHGVIERVGLRRAQDAGHSVGLRIFEGVAENPFGSLACENGFLNGAIFIGRAPSAVFALGVLANDNEVDLVVFERRYQPGKELDGTHVDILIESCPDGQKQFAQGNVIGDPGEAHSAQKNGIAVPQDLHAVGGHHFSMFQIVGAAPRQIVVLELEAPMLFRDGIEDPDAFVYDIDADAVTGNEVDFVGFHIYPFERFLCKASRKSFSFTGPGATGSRLPRLRAGCTMPRQQMRFSSPIRCPVRAAVPQ